MAVALPRRRAKASTGAAVGPIGLGVASLWLSIIVLLPLAAVLTKSLDNGIGGLWDAINAPAARAALIVTVAISAIVALINVVTGTLIAWVLVRDNFRGKSFVNALIDLPFALPTIVAGLTLLALYGKGSPLGINVSFTQIGVAMALLFVTLPFVVRSVQPVLMELDPEGEEAGGGVGATTLAVFRRITFPAIRPAMLAGVALSFGRALG